MQPVLSEERRRPRIMLLQAQLPWIDCLLAPFKPLSAAVQAAGTIQLERLAWAVFDNIMGPGARRHHFLSWRCIMKSLNVKQAKHIKDYTHVHCPASDICFFWRRCNFKAKTWRTQILKKPGRPQCYSMTWDVRKEYALAHILLSK